MKLEAQNREVLGKKVKNLRAEGLVPAAVYGPKRDSVSVSINAKTFGKLFKEVGYNKFIDLEIEGEKKASKVLVKEVQIDPIKDYFVSVSFYQVDEDTKISVDVPVILENEAPALKLNLGFLVQNLDTIALHCLPKDVPASLPIDISVLDETGSSVSISDIKLPEGVELESGIDETTAIVYIAARQKEEVVATEEVELDEEGNPIEKAEGEKEEGESSEEEKE